MPRLARLDRDLDRGAHLVVDLHVYKLGDADDDDPVPIEIAPGQYKRLDGLVDGPGADGLYFRPFVLADDTRDCPGDSRRS